MNYKYVVKDENGKVYDVSVNPEGYIEGYSKNLFDIVPDRKPDMVDAYFQINESLPSRFQAWIV